MFVGVVCEDASAFEELGDPVMHEGLGLYMLSVQCLSVQASVIEVLGHHTHPVMIKISDHPNLNTDAGATNPFLDVEGRMMEIPPTPEIPASTRRTPNQRTYPREETKQGGPPELEETKEEGLPELEENGVGETCRIFHKLNGKYMYLPNSPQYTPPCGWKEYTRGVLIHDGRGSLQSTGARAFYFTADMFNGKECKTTAVCGLGIPRKPRPGQFHEHTAYEMKFVLTHDSAGGRIKGPRPINNGVPIGELGNMCDECCQTDDTVQQILMAQSICLFVELVSTVRFALFKSMSPRQKLATRYPLYDFDDKRVGWDMEYKQCWRTRLKDSVVSVSMLKRADKWLEWEAVKYPDLYSTVTEGEVCLRKRARTS